MRAHQLNIDGLIINTIDVESLDFLPDLVDASIGGGVGDSIIDGVVVPKPVPSLEYRRDVIQAQIDNLEQSTLLNRGSRELELVSMQDLATRQATVLQPSMPDKTVDEIAAALLAARPYYVKLVALDAEVGVLRTAMAAL